MKHFPWLRPNEIAHMGDTMGDSGGIVGIAEVGGIGVAFNYNDALKQFLEITMTTKSISGRIYVVDPKGDSSNLTRVLPILIND